MKLPNEKAEKDNYKCVKDRLLEGMAIHNPG